MQRPFKHDLWQRGWGVSRETPGCHPGWVHVSQSDIAGVSFELKAPSKPFTAFSLRDTQVSGREFCLSRAGSIIGDPPRMGKTGLACASHDPSEGSCWIIAPLMTQPVWQSWVKRTFDKDLTIVGAEGTLGEINFLHYEIVAKWRKLLAAHPAATMIVDEAHRLANMQEAKRALSAAASVGMLSRYARRRILLTGTPIKGRLITLRPLLAVANPGAWGSHHDFGVRYCDGQVGEGGWEYRGYSNVAELRERLKHVLLRRRRTADDGCVDRKLFQVSADTLKWPELRAVRGIQDLAPYRRALGLAKFELTRDWLESLENPIIWVWHKEVGEVVRRALKGKFIHGGKPLRKRLEIIKQWNEDGGVLVSTLPAAQEGIDLSAHRSPVVFLELDYVPASMAQAEMRPFVPGSTVDCVYVVDPVCDALVSRHVSAKVEAEDAVFRHSVLPVDLFEEAVEPEIEDLGSWLFNAWDQELTI